MNKYHQLEDFSFFLKKKDVWTHYLGLDAVFFLSFHPPQRLPAIVDDQKKGPLVGWESYHGANDTSYIF